jgi:hypothetical protein
VGPHTASAAELKDRLAAERLGAPFLIVRDDSGAQQLLPLPSDGKPVTIGRDTECGLALPWDSQVSRVHAELQRVGPSWTMVDGGLSRNGSYVNGERVHERRRLRDGDTLGFGSTAIVYRQPGDIPASAATTTAVARPFPGPAEVSRAQKAILRALCRPFASGADYAKPATNAEIAAELVLSLDAVKGHLRVLFAKFELEDLPQNEKRLRLVERSLASGAVTLQDVRGD